MKPAVAYIRVSTLDQVANGVSLEAQEARIKQWADLNGYEIIRVCRDNGISGKDVRNRPGVLEAIDLACEHRAALVVYSLSRMARSTKDALNIGETLDKAHADLVSLSEQIDTTSAAGKMVFRLLAVLAEFERDLVSERTKTAMRHMKTNGKRVGTIPYGYGLNGSDLIENPAEQPILAHILQLAAKPGMTHGMIARELNKAGLPARNDKAWTRSMIRSILETNR